MKKIIYTILSTFILLNMNITLAEQTYSPEQLRTMIFNKNYPSQSDVYKTTTTPALFPSCKSSSKEILSQIQPYYPVQIIVDTDIVYTVKAWINDGVMAITCSKPDMKMIVTNSHYD